jgi:cobalt-zinc-cadmium efflux system membrane fusion protein
MTFIIACNTTQETHNHEDQSHVHEQQNHEHEGMENIESEYKLMRLEPGDFCFIYKTSGQLLPDIKDEIILNASSTGIISFSDNLMYPGIRVTKNQEIFTISGKNLIEDNTEIKYQKTESAYITARENFERAKKMYESQLITEEHFLEKKLFYEQALAEYNNFQRSFSVSGNRILSPAEGYIKDLLVAEGQMVHTGDRIASVITEHNLVLKADIPPADLEILSKVHRANFSTDQMNGRIISYGKSIGQNSYYIPLFFRISYDDDLIPGTFADIWLIGDTVHDALIIPNTALMEEFGKRFVFREKEDGSFEKRYISTGNTDGSATQVMEGLQKGDIIVSEGAYFIKLALQSSTIPSTHSHNH